jgi:hypothetical protein
MVLDVRVHACWGGVGVQRNLKMIGMPLHGRGFGHDVMSMLYPCAIVRSVYPMEVGAGVEMIIHSSWF